MIGTGKRQYRNVVRISQQIDNGFFEKNEVLSKIFSEVTGSNNRIHFVGCITDSQEEASSLLLLLTRRDIKHLYKLLECAKASGVREAYIHCILDGEDAPNGKWVIRMALTCRGLELTKDLEEWTVENDFAVVGSVAGKKGILDSTDTLVTMEKYMKVLLAGDNLTNVTVSDYIQLRYDISNFPR